MHSIFKKYPTSHIEKLGTFWTSIGIWTIWASALEFWLLSGDRHFEVLGADLTFWGLGGGCEILKSKLQNVESTLEISKSVSIEVQTFKKK